MTSKNDFFSTYNMSIMAVGAVLITICSWLSVNLGDVPFTLQTFAIFAVLMLLGGKRGTVSIVLYLLMGLIGLPVFAGFKGGAQALVGPTGGFLVGFIAVGLIYCVLADVIFASKRHIAISIGICILCTLILYAIGTIWFVNIYASDSGKVGYSTAIAWCITPFIVPDIIKIVLAALVADRISFIIKK